MHIPAYLDAPPSTHLNACVRYATMRMLTTFEHQKQQSQSKSSCLLTHCDCHLQLTVEPHPLLSMASYSLIPTQQKVQWWCSSVTQGLSLRERWQQCVGVMVHGCEIKSGRWPGDEA